MKSQKFWWEKAKHLDIFWENTSAGRLIYVGNPIEPVVCHSDKEVMNAITKVMAEIDDRQVKKRQGTGSKNDK